MITKEQVKQVLFILNNEYEGVLKGNQEMDNLKIDTWYAKLKNFEYKQVQQAVSKLLDSKVFGKPNISDLMEILKPTLENQNEGIEFAIRMIDLLRMYGTDKMKDYVNEEFGEVGYSVYKQTKEDLRMLTINDTPNFQSKLRDVFNSYKEREKHNKLDKLPYKNKNQKFIEKGEE